MNIVLHQFKKDLLRARIVVVIWFLLVLLQFALVGWNAKPGDAVMQGLYSTLSTLLVFFNAILILVIVPLLIQQEPLVGTTAFWFTRPIARGTLLLSKALFISLLVLLPLLVQSIVFAANGVTIHDVLLAVPELLLGQLSWIVVVAVLSVLTPNFARFAIVGAIILVAWIMAMFLLQVVTMFHDPQAYMARSPSLTSSRSVVLGLVMIGFGGAAVVVQYLTRRRTLVIGLAVAVVVVGMLVQYLWPWDFLKPQPRLAQDSTFNAAAVTAKLTSPVSASDQMEIRGGVPLKQIQDTIVFDDYPKGYVIKIKDLKSSLKSADGHDIPVQDGNARFDYSTLDPIAMELGLDGVPVLNADNFSSAPQMLFSITADLFSRYAKATLAYMVKIDCTAYKYVVATELPLRKGARFDRGSEHLVITDVLDQTDGVDIQLREKNINLLFAPRDRQANSYDGRDRENTVYVLLNKARRQAVVQKNTGPNFSFGATGTLINNPLRISFGPENNNFHNWLAPHLDEDWLADAVLVRLDLTPVCTFQRTLSVPGFRLDGKFDLPENIARNEVADLDALDQIKLPHDATRDQVRRYITDVLVASRRISENEHDPQIDILEKVGAQNVDILIQMARDNHNFYLNRAINDLVQPDQKEMVVEALATNHDLLDTIVDHGWQADAKATLLAVFADKTSRYPGYPSQWVDAVAALKDPSTYDALKGYYIDNPSDQLFEALESAPGFDLAGAVDLAWKKVRGGPAWKSRQVLVPAAKFGEPDVVEVAINLLKDEGNGGGRKRARQVLRDYTPATGETDADLIAWWEANRANLAFDPTAKKFVLRSSAAPPTTDKTGP